jgi:uncharacterized protein YlxP (DUF503 family)
MVVGAALVELHVHGSRSLKEKRGVLQSIKRRVRNRFNLAVAAVGGQDTWQRALLGLGAVGGDAGSVRAALEKALRFIEELHLAEVLNSDVECIQLPHEECGPGPWEDEEPDSGEE